MTAIEVGATGIIDNNGSALCLTTVLPRDLLVRVTTQRALVAAHDDGADIVRPEVQFSDAIVEAAKNDATDQEPVAVVYPAWWSARACEAVQGILGESDSALLMFDDAEAAIAQYATEVSALPDTIAVVSLRAGQSSVVIAHNCQTRPATLPSPALVHDEGGDDLDAAVLRHVLHSLASIGNADIVPEAMLMAAALTQCRDVREMLSESATETIELELPGVTASVRLVRSEIEEIARPWVDDVVRLVMSALDLYGAPVDAVLLTGGVATMPLVSQRMSADLGLDVFLPSQPALVAVRGAELLRRRSASAVQQQTDVGGMGGWRALLARLGNWRVRDAAAEVPIATGARATPEHQGEAFDDLPVDIEHVFAAALQQQSPTDADDDAVSQSLDDVSIVERVDVAR